MSKKILVIDDEPLILVTVEKALSRLGYRIVTAQDMKEFERALHEGPFDLLITDLNMEGATPDTIIARVKERSPSVTVLKMSGSVNREKSHDFIEKPFRIEELRDKVRSLIHEHS